MMLMGISQGLVALNANLSPAIPWFPIPALVIIFLATGWVRSRWPIRLIQPVVPLTRAYAFALLITYAVICMGIIEAWLNNLTLKAPSWPDQSLSDGFQITFLLVIPLIAAWLAEVGFRGLVQTPLEKILPLWPMLFLIAVINYLMHFYDPDQGGQLLRLLGLNFAWGYITWRVQSIRPALAGHIAMNICIPLWHYGSERFGPGPLAFGEFGAVTLVVFSLTGAAALIVALFVSRKLPAYAG
jgi:membrane protease YdiL (CAAX protease family)